MQAQTSAAPRPEGKPPLPIAHLKSNRPGVTRQSLDYRVEMLQAIENLAQANPAGALSRADMTRQLLSEALAARGVDWTTTYVPPKPAKKRGKKGAKK